ncbi:MAG TPA: helix-turn-helix domain-containing protein [Candidatus Nanoarchaeia archaeon]|nr:helix-turn-helix domain-containing protein [Candidatus Nanoarchaeia archaeon]
MSKDEKYILIDLEDDKSKKIAESIANKTARKILDYLSSKEEAGAEEIAKELGLPLSTIDYNLKNLKLAGLIETKRFQWSSRGKKIALYKVANKFIVIAPKGVSWKDEIKKILPFVGISAILAGAIEYMTKPQPIFLAAMQKSADTGLAQEGFAAAPSIASPPQEILVNHHYGLWFFIFTIAVILIYLAIRAIKRKQ